MAGGKGTRISSLFPDIPKPLIPIEDKNGVSKPVLGFISEQMAWTDFSEEDERKVKNGVDGRLILGNGNAFVLDAAYDDFEKMITERTYA